MLRKAKSSFTSQKNKLVSFLLRILRILRSGLRILFLIIFFHWILWFTTYAKSTTYYESISEENTKQEEKKLHKHDNKTDKYNSRGLLGDKYEEKNITQIEDDILSQIENKKEGLKKGDLPRKWAQEKLPNLEKLQQEIKEKEQKDNKTEEEKKELEKKRNDYKSKLEKAKKETIDNIQEQLKNNDLNITELDDNRSWGQKITHDPLKFALISPLNKGRKMLGLQNHLFLEIIFKLVIIEIISVCIYYSETIKFWENAEKMRDPYLSVEEKEQLNEEINPLVKYLFFNGFMMFLFIVLFYHPALFDRTDPLWKHGTPGTEWYIWIIPLFISVFLANISNEFLLHGRLLNKQELKNYIVKNWAVTLLITLIVPMAFPRFFRMNSMGNNFLALFGGLVKFGINAVRAKLLGHREYSHSSGSTRRPISTSHIKRVKPA